MAQNSLIDELIRGKDFFLSASFSKPAKTARCAARDGTANQPFFERVKIKPANKNGTIGYFAEFFTNDKTFHRVYSFDDLLKFVQENFPAPFKSCVVRFYRDSALETLTALANKKGKITLISHTCARDAPSADATAHNRAKHTLIPEGEPAPFLVHLGVMTPDGAVIASKRKKFRQMNRFLEYVDDMFSRRVSSAQGTRDAQKLFRIVDFGSGKSYLTFAVHYLFTRIYKLPVEITGVDIKADVVAHCNKLARCLRCDGLSFAEDRIENFCDRVFGGYSAGGSQNSPPDLFIMLHACDTATDYALAAAIAHDVPAVMAVPCCQHELNALLSHDSGLRTAGGFSPLMSHGLLRERFSALATDAARIALLEQAGYSVQALEFTEAEDTQKNLLIRAEKTPSAKNRRAALGIEKDPLSRALGVTLTLEKLLRNSSI
ncbi:MAG: SAM-dependent methyltransferase [Treponemataceae bacterium]|nr:MAG: SAM-dependent methyltransferase [Treponemataceae bacterium]